jgi:hypothetical protein
MKDNLKNFEVSFSKLIDDSKPNSSHFSIMVALYLIWQKNNFLNPISITRSEVLRISKIGSQGTYHKCIKQLQEWGYLIYKPSYDPIKGSLIYLCNYDIGSEQVSEQFDSKTKEQNEGIVQGFLFKDVKQDAVCNNKTFVRPKIEEVNAYFENDYEASRFFNFFESNGWKVGRNGMKNWQAAANNWKRNSKNNWKEKTKIPKANHLYINEDKDYSIAL